VKESVVKQTAVVLVLFSFSILLCAAGLSLGSQVFMVKDIDKMGPSPSSAPEDLRAFAGLVYFSADDGVHGRELWKSDGTAGGTRLVRDIVPGSRGSNPFLFTRVGSKLFFMVQPANVLELWMTDGTAAGTARVKVLGKPYSANYFMAAHAVQNVLLFAYDDGIHGVELWKSNGTEAGTTLVKDINSGPTGSNPTNFAELNGKLYFSAISPGAGRELMVSDGTGQGTSLVKDIFPGPSDSRPRDLTLFGSLLFLSATDTAHGEELWETDGTPTGTRLALNINGGGSPSLPQDLTVFQNYLYFVASDQTHGSELWRVDPSYRVSLFADLNPGPGDSDPANLTPLKNCLLFTAHASWKGNALWKTDGTRTGTTLVRGIGSNSFSILASTPALALMEEDKPYHQATLWASDGTMDGTRMIGSYEALSSAVGLDGIFLFTSYENVHGNELWRSDGTTAGTHMVLDILKGNDGSYPRRFVTMQGFLYFSAITGDRSFLWQSDGSAVGTRPISAEDPAWIAPTRGGLVLSEDVGVVLVNPMSGDRRVVAKVKPSFEFSMLAGKVVFLGSDAARGQELWVSDGTVQGTYLLKDVIPGKDSSSPRFFARAGNLVYFVAGNAIWRTDGTSPGTMLFNQLPVDFIPRDIAVAGATLFLDAWTSQQSEQLWRVDPSGAPVLLTMAGGYLYQDTLTAVGNAVYFVAYEGGAGVGLWKSGGTPDSTTFVVDLVSGPSGSYSKLLTPFGGRVMYNSAGRLWMTDGTPDGTIALATMESSNCGAAIGTNMVFSGQTGSVGMEPWVTDGTPAGTHLVSNIARSAYSSYPCEYINLNGAIFFSADDQIHGDELWSLTLDPK
jgi:ELWxxDGT repeat protein